MEMLSNGGLRTHVHGSLVTDDKIEFLYFDRSVHARSEPIYFQHDPLPFIAALDALVKLNFTDIGFLGILKKPTYLETTKLPETLSDREKVYKVFEGTELKLANGYVLELGEEVFHQHALIGRGTCVVKAIIKPPPGQRVVDDAAEKQGWTKPLVVKFSFGASSRAEKESEIVRKLRGLALKQDREMLNHLPNILYSENHELSGIPKRMADRLDEVLEGFYERRTLHISVQEELSRVKDLVAEGNVEGFGLAVTGVYKCMCKHSLM